MLGDSMTERPLGVVQLEGVLLLPTLNVKSAAVTVADDQVRKFADQMAELIDRP